MNVLIEAAVSPWGIAGAVFLGVAALAAFSLKGQVRAFVAIVMLGVAVVLGAVAVVFSLPEREVGTDVLAGLETDIPDSDRELAERLMVRALVELNAGNTREARNTYARARSIYRELSDILGEGMTALGLAQLEHITGQSDTARANYAEALGLFRQGGSAEWLAKAMAAWGDLEKDTFNWEEAANLYAQAREQWARAPKNKTTDHAILRMDAAASLPEDEGREVLDQAQLIYNNLGDPTGLGDVAMIYGDLEMRAGNSTAARGQYGNARTYYMDGPHPDREADAVLRVAAIDLARGYNLQVAFGLEIAEPLYRRAGDGGGLARIRVLRGDVARLTGELDLAGSEYAAAADAFNALSHRDEPLALFRLGQIQAAVGDSEAANQTVLHAISLFHQFNIDAGEAEAKLARGTIARGSGNSYAALLELEGAAELFEELGDALGQGRALLEWARVDASSGRDVYANQRANEAAALFAGAGSSIGQVEVALELGNWARDGGDAGAAAVSFSQAAEMFAAIDSPLAAMNGFLGLPETSTLRVFATISPVNLYEDIADAFEEPAPEDVAAIEANLAAHPDYLIEGRTALAGLAARVAEADAFVRARN